MIEAPTKGGSFGLEFGTPATPAVAEVKESSTQTKSTAAVKHKHKPSKRLVGYTAVLVEPFTVENGKSTKDFPAGEEASLQLAAMTALRASKIFDHVVDGTQKTEEPLSSEARLRQRVNGWPHGWASMARRLLMHIPESTGANYRAFCERFPSTCLRRYRLSQIFRIEIFEASLSVLREAIGVFAKPQQGLSDQEDV